MCWNMPQPDHHKGRLLQFCSGAPSGSQASNSWWSFANTHADLEQWCGQKQRITKTRIKLYNHPKPSLFNCILSPEFHPKPCFWDPGHRHLKPPCVTQRPLSSRTATMEVPEAWATPSKGKTCEDERRSYLFTILMLFSYHNLKLQRN